MSQMKITGLKAFFEKLFGKKTENEIRPNLIQSEEGMENQPDSEEDWKKKYKDLTVTEIQNKGIGTL